MKQLLKLFLFMGVLCLTGCSEDEPQSVAFSVKEHRTGVSGEILIVTIEANCAWTLSENSREVIVEQMSGKGSGSVCININRNLEYDELTHRITVASEDGTSTDVLTIIQEQNTATEIGTIDMLSEEGGTFTIPVKTNDDITSVDTPDWITFTPSRALTDYTYTFTAEPNKTGTARKGNITLRGKALTQSIEVSQDSYAPDSAWVEIPVCVLRDTSGSYPINVTPEYADISKLRVESDFYLWSRIEGDHLFLEYYSPETHMLETAELRIYIEEKLTWSQTVGIVKPQIDVSSDKYIYFPEENFYISSLPEPYGRWELSDPTVITRLENGKFAALKNGICTVSVTSLANGYTHSKTFTVYDVALDSRLYGWSNPYGDLYHITFHSEARGKGITEYKMYMTIKGSTEQISIMQGRGSDGTYRLDYTATIPINASSEDEIFDLAQNATFHFEGTVNGKHVSSEIPAEPRMER